MRKTALWPLAATLGVAVTGYASPVNPPSATTTPQASAPNPQEQTMTASLTAEDIGHRVLKLIDTIHSVDDISPKQIEKTMGIKVELNATDPNEYGFGGKLTDDWSYGFGSLTDPTGAKPTRLLLSFDDQTHNRADMAPICKLDYDGYSKFLTDAGFKKSPIYADHGRLSFVNFTRGRVAVEIKPDGDGNHTCVSMLTIEVLPTDGGHA